MNQTFGQRGLYSGGHNPHRDDRSPAPEDVANIKLSSIQLADKPAADLFSTHAENAAKAVSDASKELNKASQLRRFYDELVMWQERVGADAEKFSECEPYIRMLKAKTAYAKGRKHVDANFRALFNHLIDQSINATTLRQAKLFFEAFMAYYKIYRQQ
jgi:CRISPR-associated protein Csm2